MVERKRETGWGIVVEGKWEGEGCQGNWLLSDKLTIEIHSCYISLITPSLPSPVISESCFSEQESTGSLKPLIKLISFNQPHVFLQKPTASSNTPTLNKP